MATKTYTAVARDTNSWTPDGIHCTTWTCGHGHRTLLAALKCLRSMGDAACSYHANIEDQDGNVQDTQQLAHDLG